MANSLSSVTTQALTLLTSRKLHKEEINFYLVESTLLSVFCYSNKNYILTSTVCNKKFISYLNENRFSGLVKA